MRKHMKETLIFLALLLGSYKNGGAQNWPAVFLTDGDANEAILALQPLPDDGWASAGLFTGSSPFPGQPGSQGRADLFLARYNEAGQLLWSVQGGESENEEVSGLALHPSGDLVLSGAFWGSLTLGDTTLQAGSSLRALFIARFSPEGTLRRAYKIGGEGLKDLAGLHFLPDTSMVISGYFEASLELPDTLLQSQAEPGSTSLFAARLSPNGQALWVQQAGTFGNIRIQSMAVAPDGQINVGGNFDNEIELAGTTLDAGFFNQDVFLAALSPEGSWLWARDLGGVIDDELTAMATDAEGNVYAAGNIVGVMTLADTLSIQSSNGNADIFLVKYLANGQPAWARALGGPDVQAGASLAVNDDNVVVLGGSFQGPINFDGISADAGTDGASWGLTSAFRASDGSTRWLIPIPADLLGLTQALSFRSNGQLLAGGTFGQTAMFDGLTFSSEGNTSAFTALLNPVLTPASARLHTPSRLKAFPNPTSGWVTLQGLTSQSSIRWFDKLGRPVQPPRAGLAFDLTGYPPGAYFVVAGQQRAQVLLLR